MGQVIPFDRAARAHADYTVQQVLRRCRMAAICAGCNNIQRKAVEEFGERLLSEGFDAHTIIVRARSVAEAMVHPEPLLGA